MLKKTNRFLALVLAIFMLVTMVPLNSVLADQKVTSPDISFRPSQAAEDVDLPALDLGDGGDGTGEDPDAVDGPEGGVDPNAPLDPEGGVDPNAPLDPEGEVDPDALLDPEELPPDLLDVGDLDATTSIHVSLAADSVTPVGNTVDVMIGDFASVTLSADNGWSASLVAPVYEETPATEEEIALGEAEMPGKIDYTDMPVDASVEGASSDNFTVFSAAWASDNQILVALGADLDAAAAADADLDFSVTKFWYGASESDISTVVLNFVLEVQDKENPDKTVAEVITWPHTLLGTGYTKYSSNPESYMKTAEISIPNEVTGKDGTVYTVLGKTFLNESVSGWAALAGSETTPGGDVKIYNTIKRNTSLVKEWAPASEGGKYKSVTVRMTSNNPAYNDKFYTLERTNSWYLNLGSLPMGGKVESGYDAYWYKLEETAITKLDNTTVPVSTYDQTYVHSTSEGSVNANGNLQLSVTNADRNIGDSGTLTIRKLWDGKTSYTDIGSGQAPPMVSGKVYLTCPDNAAHNTSVPFSFSLSTGTTSITLPLKDSTGHFYRFRIEEELPDNSNFRPVYQSFTTTDNINYVAIIDNISLKTKLTGTKQWSPTTPPAGTSLVEVELYRNGQPTGIITVARSSNGWTYSFDDLPRFDDNGNLYIYTVKEVTQIAGYHAYNNGNNLVNVSDTGNNEIVASLSKTWNNGSYYALNYRAVSIDLVDITAGDKVVFTWNIPAGSSSTIGRVLSVGELNPGTEINPDHSYKLEEKSIATDSEGKPLWSFSYEATWGGSGRFLIMSGVNTLLGNLEDIPTTKIDIRVSKNWDEGTLSAADMAYYAQAHKATFELYRDGKPTGITLNVISGTQAFADQPKYDPGDGHEYVYSVVETSVNNAYISTHYINSSGTWVFTNTLKKLSTTASSYTKYFEFGGLNTTEIEERLPANATLTFQLMRKKKSQDDNQFSLVETRTLTRAQYIGSIMTYLKIEFSNLPQYSPYVSETEPAEEYVYKLVETSIPTADGKPLFSVQYGGNTIINTFQGDSPKAAVTVTKDWMYSSTYPADCTPQAIRFEVYEQQNPTVLIGTYEISGSGYSPAAWTKTINLERYVLDKNNMSVFARYTIVETHVQMKYDGEGEDHKWSAGQWLPIGNSILAPAKDDPYWNVVVDGTGYNRVTISNAPTSTFEIKGTTTLRVYKEWGNAQNPTGGAQPKEPTDKDGVVFNIYADGELKYRATPTNIDSPRGGDSVVVYNVPADDDGRPIVYSATEDKLVGYATTLKQNFVMDPESKELYAIFLNTYSPLKVNITVNKIFGTLLYPGMPLPPPEAIEVRWETEASVGPWTKLGPGYTVTFEDLTMYTDETNTKKVEYTIAERTTINGLPYTFTGGNFGNFVLTRTPTKELNGLYTVAVKNDILNTTSISGTKTWKNAAGAYLAAAQHPSTIELELYRDEYVLTANGGKGALHKSATGTTTYAKLNYTGPSSNVYNWSITDLPRYGLSSVNGETIVIYEYYVKEVPIPGFKAPVYKMGGNTVSPPSTTTGVLIENVSDNPPLGSIKVSKSWKTSAGVDIPWVRDVVVTLYRHYTLNPGGAKKETTGQTATLSSAVANQTFTFTDLPLSGYVSSQHVTYTYSVEEAALTGFTATYSPSTPVTPGAATPIVITNTQETPGTIYVTKTWVGDSANVRPTSIDVTLTGYRGSTAEVLYGPSDKTLSLSSATLSGNTYTWNAAEDQFTNLPKYHNDGTAIRYVLTETALSNYSTTINPTATTLNGKTTPFAISITNTRGVSNIKFNVTKLWSTPNGGGHPNDVTLQLYRSSYVPDTGTTVPATAYGQTFNMNPSNPAADSWTWTSGDLPTSAVVGTVYTEYTYYVKEVNVPNGFTVTYSGGGDMAPNGGTITNTSTLKEITVSYEKRWLDRDGVAVTYELPTAQLVLKRTVNGGATPQTVGTYQVGKNGTLTQSIQVLPFEYKSGVLYTYTNYFFEEANVPAGYVVTYQVGGGSIKTVGSQAIVGDGEKVVVTNTERDQRGRIDVVKAWQDASGASITGETAVEIQFTLVGKIGGENGTVVPETSFGDALSYVKGLTRSYANLPVWYQGQRVTYYVRETETDAHAYTMVSITSSGNVTLTHQTTTTVTITNKLKVPDTASLIVTKAWKGNTNWPANVASIGFTVKSRSSSTGAWTTVKTGTLTKGTPSVRYDDLPVKDIQGNDISYLVEETVDASKFALDSNTSAPDGVKLVKGTPATVTITNQLNPPAMGQLKVSKAWQDGDKWPTDVNKITVSYTADMGGYTGSFDLTSGDRSHIFTNLPVTYNGADITYTVSESCTNTRVTWVSTSPTSTTGPVGVKLTLPGTTENPLIPGATVVFTNGLKSEVGKLIVNKKWAENAWPTTLTGINITVQPTVGGANIGTALTGTIPSSTSTLEFSNLPVKDYDGNLITYVVSEKIPVGAKWEWVSTSPGAAQNASVTLSTTASTPVTFTNKESLRLGSLKVIKAWEGGSWPTGQTIRVTYKSSSVNDPVGSTASVLLSAGQPNHTWGNLPYQDDLGAPYTYRVSETIEGYDIQFVKVDPAGPTPADTFADVNLVIDGTKTVEFTNRYLPPLGSLTVKKAWTGNGSWPSNVKSIEFRVKAFVGATEIKEYGPFNLTPTTTSHQLTDLPVRDKDGKAIRYQVVETVAQALGVAKYTPTYQHPNGLELIGGKDVDSTVTNTPVTPVVGSLYVKKVWNEGNWPAKGGTITVAVSSSPAGFAPSPAATVTLSSGNIDHTFTNLRVLDDDDKPITYTVSETFDNGEAVWVSTKIGTVATMQDAAVTLAPNQKTDVTFTNKLADPDTGSLKVTKVWKDSNGAAAVWPEWVDRIDVEVIATLGNVDTTVRKGSILKEGPHSMTFSGLDITGADRTTLISYSVVETIVPTKFHAYSVTPSVGQKTSLSITETREIILNNVAVPQLGTLVINKAWLNAEGNPAGVDDHLFPITYRLVGKVGAVEVASTVKTGTLDEAHGWTARFEGLPLYYNNEAVKYYLTETSSDPHYVLTGNTAESGITLIAGGEQTATLTNRLNQREYGKLTVRKAWVGDTWPTTTDSITINVRPMVNGQPYGSLLSKNVSSTDTFCEFDRLPLEDEKANVITYVVSEVYPTGGKWEWVSSTVNSAPAAQNPSVTLTANAETVVAFTNRENLWLGSLKVSKIWEGGTWPAGQSIAVSYKASTVNDEAGLVGSVVLTADYREHIWDNLPYQDDKGVAYTYVVSETITGHNIQFVSVSPADPTATGASTKVNLVIAGTTPVEFKNRWLPPLGTLTVKKAWAGGKWPSNVKEITFRVKSLVDGTEISESKLYTLSPSNPIEIIPDLPVRDGNGRNISYQVVETPNAAKYTTVYEHPNGVELRGGSNVDTTVTNTPVDPIVGSLYVKKLWNEGSWPTMGGTVTVRVSSNPTGFEPSPASVTLSSGTFEHTFLNLRVLDDDDKPITYTVWENFDNGKAEWVSTTINTVASERSAIVTLQSNQRTDVVFTNKLADPDTGSLKVAKVWKDSEGDDTVWPAWVESIDIEVFETLNGAKRSVIKDSLTKDKQSETYNNLRIYGPNLIDVVTYSVEETVVSTRFIRYADRPDAGQNMHLTTTDVHEITLYNTAEPQFGNLTINKVWLNDKGDVATGDDFVFPITYRLTGKIGDITVPGSVKTGTLDHANNWTVPYENLPLYYNNQLIKYYLEETSRSEYYEMTINTAANGVTLIARGTQTATLTNRLNEPVLADLVVTKKWANETSWPENTVIEFTVTGRAHGDEVFKQTGTLSKGNTSVKLEKLNVSHHGEKISYSVTETAADGFTQASIVPASLILEKNGSNEFIITNTYKRISVDVTKKWLDDDDNSTSTRGPVEIELVPSVKLDYAPLVVKLDGSETPAWKHTFEKLPQYAYVAGSGFQLVQYTVREITKPGRYVQEPIAQPTMTSDTNSYSVIVENRLQSAELKGKKTWVNTTDVDGVTATIANPGSIVVTLKRVDGSPIPTDTGLVLTKTATAPSWEWEFNLLPGETKEYYVVEDQAPGTAAASDILEGEVAGYVHENVQDMDITNTPITMSYAVSKRWSGQQGALPAELKVTLHSTPASVLGAAGIERTLNAANGWGYVFNNLPTHTYVNGVATKIVYSATEETVRGFTSSANTSDIGTDFTNTLSVFDIEVEKTWVEGDYKQRPAAIDVILKRRLATEPDSEGETVEVKALAITDSEKQKVTFRDLPKYAMVRDDDGVMGVPYVYFAEESTVHGYKFSLGNTLSVVDKPTGGTIAITNTLVETDATIVKRWFDANLNGVPNGFGLRPDKLTFTLLQNGVAFDTRTIDVNDTEDIHTVKFLRLPALDRDGKAYVYTVEEDQSELKDYTAIINPLTVMPGEDGINHPAFQISNKLETIGLKLIKVWVDDADHTEYRPKGALKFTVTGTAEGGYSASYTFNMANEGAAATWSQEVVGLPKTAKNGKLIEYTVREEMVNNNGESLFAYETSYSDEGVLKPGADPAMYEATITNKLRRVTFGVEKVWEDMFGNVDNKYKMRPEKLTVTLYAKPSDDAPSVVEVDTVVLSDANGWFSAFKSHPTYQPGAQGIGDKWIYGVDEKIEDCYERELAPTVTLRDGVYRFKLTNKLRVQNMILSKKWANDNNFQMFRPDSITLTISTKLEDGTPVFEDMNVQLFLEKAWTTTIANLPIYNKEGKKIIYTIAEKPVPGYEPSYTQPALVGGTLVGSVVNTMQTGRVRVIKNWRDISRAQSPAVEISLYADSILVNTYDYSNTNYDMTFDDLPIFNASTGQRIVYRAIENTAALPADHYYVSMTSTTPDGYLAQLVVLNEYSTTPPPNPPTPPTPGEPTVDPGEFIELDDTDIPLSMGGTPMLHLGDCFD